MRPAAFLGLCFLSLALPFMVQANPHGQSMHNHHREIANRARGDMQLHRRFSNTRFTFYDVGLGACGKWNVASDFIVALNSAQYGGGYPGPHCFQSITISYGGKTTNAVIRDECPGCPYGGLDMSRGLFQFFAPESVGVLYGSWYYNGGSGGNDPPPPPPPAHSSTHHSTPPPPPTTTHHSTTSTTTTSKSKSTSSTSSSTTTSSSTSSDPLAEPTAPVTGNHVIDVIYEVALGLGDVVAAGAHAAH